MEDNTNLQKQNKTLKIILALLSVIVVFGLILVAIAGTYYFATRSNDDNLGSKNSNSTDAKRDNTNANSNTATAAAVATPASTPAMPATPTPEKNDFVLVGRWIETNPNNGDKYTHIFDPPKKVGNNLTGSVRVIEPYGKERMHIYTVVSSSKLLMNYDGQSTQAEDCSYDVESGGRSVKLTCDGRISHLDRARR